MKARSGFPCVKKTPQLGPKMAPKLGFQFEASTWVALCVHTGNPKSKARFRCPELSCFWNPFGVNNIFNQLTDKQVFSIRYCLHQHLRKQKRRACSWLAKLVFSWHSRQSSLALFACDLSRTVEVTSASYLLELISCPLFVSPNPHTFYHPHNQQNPADIHANAYHPLKPLCTT